MKCYVGVEIGAKLIQVGLISKEGRLISRSNAKTKLKERSLSDIIAEAASIIRSLLAAEGMDIKSVKYIGVGCPGIPDDESGTIVKTHIMGFYNAPIRDEFRKHFNLPIYIENDASCAALAENVAGAAEELDYSVTINLGTGISGGIIIDNKIYSGFNNAGAVLGHMVIDKSGWECSCGRRGCFQALCSSTAIIKETMRLVEEDPDSLIMQVCEGDLDKINETTIFKAMKMGDEKAGDVCAKYVDDLADALANIANILMPEVIILCGGITSLGETLLKPVRYLMKERIFSKETATPDLKLAEMGSAAVIVGAGMLGIYKHR
jgi:glucokinase